MSFRHHFKITSYLYKPDDCISFKMIFKEGLLNLAIFSMCSMYIVYSRFENPKSVEKVLSRLERRAQLSLASTQLCYQIDKPKLV